MKIYIHNTSTSPEGESYRQRLRMMGSESASGQIVSRLVDCDICLIIGSQFHTDMWLPMVDFLRENHAVPLAVLNEQDCPLPIVSGLYASVRDRDVRKHIRSVPYSCLNNDLKVEDSAQKPKYLYSFIGSNTHPCRQTIFSIVDERSKICEVAGAWSRQSQGGNLHSFQQTIIDSKFVLCPRGHGPSSFRLYEVIAAGRVPVVISDSWAPPARIPWESMSIRVSESDVHLLPEIIRVNEDRYEELQRNVVLNQNEYLSDSSLFEYYVSELESITGHHTSGCYSNRVLLQQLSFKVSRKIQQSIIRSRVAFVP